MKAIKTILAITVATSFVSNAADLSQAQAGFQHAERMASSTQASVGSVSLVNGKDGATVDAEHTAAAFSAARAQAAADLNAAAAQAAHDAAPSPTTPAQLQNYGVKGNPNLTPQTSPPQQQPAYYGASMRPGTNSMINVPASSLGKAPVTFNGKTVPANTLPGDTQVAVGFTSAFSPSPRKGGHDHNNRSNGHGGTGNGANNAANSRSANGLGGGNHVGGGSAQSGSRNIGHW